MAADRLVAQHALFARCFYRKPTGACWPFQVFGKSKSSVLSLLDLVFRNLAPLEFPHCAMERGRSFRRVRLGPLVPENLCYRSSISGRVASFPDFAGNLVSLLCMGVP